MKMSKISIHAVFEEIENRQDNFLFFAQNQPSKKTQDCLCNNSGHKQSYENVSVKENVYIVLPR
jgi:hypothetical protein